MTSHRSQSLIAALIVSIGAWLTTGATGQDPLPSWNDTAAKRAIAGFVDRVVKNGGPDYVAPAERIAVFDNDGTLWCEQPMYVQLAYALDRVKALAPQHPDWKTTEPFASMLKGDLKSANGFKTFVVSGGGIDCMRPWTEKTYGIPPEQVLGSAAKTTFEMRDGKPVLLRQPGVDVIDDKQGKPINIHKVIGRRPIFAFGNSDGDQQMLEWTAAGSGARFMGLVHHTDAAREFEYDRRSSIGKLDAALDEATAKKWTVVSMKDDWNTVFPK
jgi:hypothetical protein